MRGLHRGPWEDGGARTGAGREDREVLVGKGTEGGAEASQGQSMSLCHTCYLRYEEVRNGISNIPGWGNSSKDQVLSCIHLGFSFIYFLSFVLQVRICGNLSIC